jgi:PPOX class probable FMN-dependent enzyme
LGAFAGFLAEGRVKERFEEVIRTRERLRELFKPPSDMVNNKVIDHIDDICRRFIAASPFVMVATRGADGRLDLSPKGDPAGFVTVLDEKTLAIPDRLGNHRVDTFENLLVNPEIGLFFLIPGNGDTLRVSGKGQIVRDGELQCRMAMNGKEPLVILVVAIEEAFMHCPKCMVRSRLWKPTEWPDRTGVPTLAEAMVAHAALSETVREMQDIIDEDGAKRMY